MPAYFPSSARGLLFKLDIPCLHFDLQNTNSCYNQLLIPKFALAIELTPETITTLESILKRTDEYEFICGMKINHGIIEVHASNNPSNAKVII